MFFLCLGEKEKETGPVVLEKSEIKARQTFARVILEKFSLYFLFGFTSSKVTECFVSEIGNFVFFFSSPFSLWSTSFPLFNRSNTVRRLDCSLLLYHNNSF